EHPRLLGELKDAVGWKRADRQVVVAGPAEAAKIGAAAHDFDEEPRSELGVGREDACCGRVNGLGGLERGLPHRYGRTVLAGRRRVDVTAHRAVGGVLRLVERWDIETALA